MKYMEHSFSSEADSHSVGKKFLTFYGMKKFSIFLVTAHNWSIQYTPSFQCPLTKNDLMKMHLLATQSHADNPL
jgi:hypothetical protein